MAETFPHGDTKWFVNDRFGMFIHWGFYSMGARWGHVFTLHILLSGVAWGHGGFCHCEF